MFKLIDKFLNQTTMYRLVLYYVLLLWTGALVLSLVGLLPYTPAALVISGMFIMFVCVAVNAIFARIFGAPSNIESVYAAAFILALIMEPFKSPGDLWVLAAAAGLAMASKYILAVNKKHIFNPAALAAVLTAIIFHQSASWWVGNLYLAPFILLGGLLMVRKLKRSGLVISFFIAALATAAFVLRLNFFDGSNLSAVLKTALLDSPMMFFAFVMLVEPVAMPPAKSLQIIYGALTGFLFSSSIRIGSVYFTPELALLAGNVFSYAVSPKRRFVLELKEKIPIAADVYDFLFKSDHKLKFKPGQYLEWTLSHSGQDARGIRRYFSVASSPAEEHVRMGVKFYPQASSFKQSMLHLNPGDKITASQLAGEFVLPKDKNKKLVFMAGGIGITPFRSMIKHLLDTKEKRGIVLLYCNKTPADIVYKDVFDQAEKELGIKIIYAVDSAPASGSWRGEIGMVDENMIKRSVPDFKGRTFYLSGSHAMVMAFEDILRKMGVKRRQIKKDFFPGLV